MKRAFTYVEMVVVLALLALLTALVAPRVVAMQTGRLQREYKSALRNIATRARSRAIESGDVVILSYDKSTKKVEAVEQSPTGTERLLQSLATPDGINPTRFSADKNATEGDTWTVPFYADGTSSGGGAEFETSDQQFSFVVTPTDGQARVLPGPMPDLSLEQWPAGTYEKRA